MSTALKKMKARAVRRAARTRSTIFGTQQRPRLSVARSLKHISAQIIDDVDGKTLVAATDKEVKATTKTDKAKAVGILLAEKAKKKNITSVVFDRGSFQYHGRVKALAEGARDGGLQF